jgi:hypothetical protein
VEACHHSLATSLKVTIQYEHCYPSCGIVEYVFVYAVRYRYYIELLFLMMDAGCWMLDAGCLM